jgi:hypothetical protein
MFPMNGTNNMLKELAEAGRQTKLSKAKPIVNLNGRAVY